MSSPEWTEWIAFYQVEPFGDRAVQHAVATLAQMFYAVHRSEKQQAILPVDHFMPGEPVQVAQPSREQLVESMKKGLRGAFGDRVHRKRR